MRIAVVGAGSWGTALANLLALQAHDVTMWAYEPEVAESVTCAHVNDLFLAECPLAPSLTARTDMAEVVRDAELIVSAAPSHAVRVVTEQIASVLDGESRLIVSVSKGLEQGSLKTMSEVLAETMPSARVAVLSGPSFAKEVYQRHPTAVVVASTESDAAETAQQVFGTSYFRVYTSSDLIGVQLGGALKNVIAIAAGILHGLDLGYNSMAALVTRGLAEMTRLGHSMGADPMTFAGLAGIGDLVLTATGGLSRNRALGIELAKGRRLDDILAERKTVAEGVRTAQAAVALGDRAGVELPIAGEVAKILFDGKNAESALSDLMGREPKAEHWR